MLGVLKDLGMEINEVEKDGFVKVSVEKVYPKFYKAIGEGDEARGKALVEQAQSAK
jgi:hypothetical protein